MLLTPEMIDMMLDSFIETLIMVGIAGVIGGAIGIPLGILLHVTSPQGILSAKVFNRTIGVLVNAVRSTPFIILLVAIQPLTRLIVGTSIGTSAALVPLTIAAAPMISRLVESSLREVDKGLIEAALSMGATSMQIIRKVLLPEALPGIIAGITIALVSLVGASAMAGAIGGGGLISGIATYIKSLYPGIQVIGVQTKDSCAMKKSIDAGHPVDLSQVGLFSDGTAVKAVGDETFRVCSEYVDDIVLVDSDEVCAAIKDIFDDTRSIVEPAGALGVAGAKAWARHNNITGKTLVAINSGANMNFERLRFVTERAAMGEEKEAMYAVTIPEERGSYRKFCHLIGDRAVTEFNYRISDKHVAQIFVGIQTKSPGDADNLLSLFTKAGLKSLNLTHDELTKLHIRHMVGGKSPLAVNERLFRFEFPEYPGALLRFLTTMNPDWNISLFHYRNNGSDYGRVLVGIQVPPEDDERFHKFLEKLGYPYVDESQNPVYKLFL
jgi:biosynthetic threonine ammonia-lyase long form